MAAIMRWEQGVLLKLWLKNPRRIGAVAVSSRELAASMARQIPKGDGWVVELGGGTGSVTRAILSAGTPPGRLVVIERDPTLHRLLVARYSSVLVILGDAQQLPSLLHRHAIVGVKAVVSSLPLLSMKKSVQYRIAAQAFACLSPGAPFIQFTYGLLSPLPRRRLGIEGAVKDRVLQNLPPASVWLYRKPFRAKLHAA